MRTKVTQAPGETDIGIREPAPKDFPAIHQISSWATHHTMANFRTEPEALEKWISVWKANAGQYPWLVAERAGEVLGFALASPFLGRCGLPFAAEVSVYVAPDEQGRGIGKALYRRLIDVLRSAGFYTAVAVISGSNPASERLHESFGFRKAGTLSGVGWKFGRWHDIGLWQLMLESGAGRPVPPGGCTSATMPRGRCDGPSHSQA